MMRPITATERNLTKTEESDLKGDDQTEAKKNSESARLWISGPRIDPTQASLKPRDRFFRYAVLPARVRICRGHPLFLGP